MHCIFFRYIIFRIFLVWKGLYVIKWPLGRNERDATLEILRSSETELPILKTKLPILGSQFQNKRTVRHGYHLQDSYRRKAALHSVQPNHLIAHQNVPSGFSNDEALSD